MRKKLCDSISSIFCSKIESLANKPHWRDSIPLRSQSCLLWTPKYRHLPPPAESNMAELAEQSIVHWRYKMQNKNQLKIISDNVEVSINEQLALMRPQIHLTSLCAPQQTTSSNSSHGIRSGYCVPMRGQLQGRRGGKGRLQNHFLERNDKETFRLAHIPTFSGFGTRPMMIHCDK